MSIIVWFLALGVLVMVSIIIGKRTGKGWMGILIDGRGRYSLSHFQVVVWTLVILSSIIGVIISRGFDIADLEFPQQLLGLMGIVAGSAAFSAGVKGAKDIGGMANVARAGPFTPSRGSTFEVEPHFGQIWLEEEGDLAEKVVNITKYQNFVFTIVVLAVYVVSVVKQGGLPTLPENIVWLIGISHAGYVGAKVPDKK